MTATVTIREEQPDDALTITSVVKRAYADVAYSDHREHHMIERLRETEAYIPALSLLAELGGKAVGHILLTPATIRSGSAAVATLALAPLSVVPGLRRQGVGSHLIAAAHAKATAMGFGSVLVVGPPGYYSRFGYARLSRYPITLPFEAPDENRMILQLRPHALDGVAGMVHYAVGWLDH